MVNAKWFVSMASATALLSFGQANASIIVDNTGATPSCDVNLVTLADTASPDGDQADACIGYLPKPGNPGAETDLLNARTLSEDWSFVYKVEKGKTDGSGVFLGISLELTGVELGSTGGNWSLTWRDANGDAASNLPLVIDIAAGFKSATSIAYFLFEGVELSAPAIQGDWLTRQGSFNLQGQHGLSHESLFVRLAQQPEEPEEPEEPQPPQGQVPAPGTLLLLAAPLLGLVARYRRRS